MPHFNIFTIKTVATLRHMHIGIRACIHKKLCLWQAAGERVGALASAPLLVPEETRAVQSEQGLSNVTKGSRTVDPTNTLLGQLLLTIEKIPEHAWQDAALCFERPPLQSRAVSFSFIHKFAKSLEAMMPSDFRRLNSYMIVGSKNLDCKCDPDELDKCMHFQNGKVRVRQLVCV